MVLILLPHPTRYIQHDRMGKQVNELSIIEDSHQTTATTRSIPTLSAPEGTVLVPIMRPFASQRPSCENDGMAGG